MDEVLSRIDAVEKTTTWQEKIDKVVWRGTPWFNPLGHPHLRKDLLKVAKGKAWADVEALSGGGGNASNALAIEEFCRYKYIVYTEGVSYSGRMPYHQACGSVLIMAPVTWRTSSALLLRPVEAEELMDVFARGGKQGKQGSREVKTVGVSETLRWEEANAIYVKADFSDLEEVILFLQAYPQVARRIAQNQRHMVVGGSYLTFAAEVCYWRALIRGWNKVAQVSELGWEAEVGERYETWLLGEISHKRGGTRGKNVDRA